MYVFTEAAKCFALENLGVRRPMTTATGDVRSGFMLLQMFVGSVVCSDIQCTPIQVLAILQLSTWIRVQYEQ